MKIILIGMPGAGKGTVSQSLCEKHQFLHLSTGDLLRKEIAKKSVLGMKVEALMRAGELAPDEWIVDVVKKEIVENVEKEVSLIFDGFPRTVQQAKDLDQFAQIDHVVFLQTDEQTAVERLKNRMLKDPNGRSDDTEDIILDRLKVYHKKTKPLLEYYSQQKKLRTIDASPPVQKVVNNVEMELGLA